MRKEIERKYRKSFVRIKIMEDTQLTLIVPCYNEEEALPIFYKELKQVLNQMSYTYEILLINDGSTDSTLSIFREIAKKDQTVKYISFSRNFGKEAAMYVGFCNAKGNYAAVMDADMQDPPNLLPKMIEILEEGKYDSVATRRFTRQGEPPIRSWFARKFYKLINQISDIAIEDGARDFRLMKHDMVDAIVEMSEYDRFSKGIFGWVGFSTCWLPFENQERVCGTTKWSFWKLTKYAINGIINFSQAPLYLSTCLGIGLSAISIMCILFTLCNFIQTNFIIDTIIFVGGLQLLCIGVLGQYIAKINTEVKARPHYIIKESNIENLKKIN